MNAGNIFWFLLLTMALGSCTLEQSKQKEVGPPNFLIIFADDMGYGDLSCYGHPTIQTPAIDQLAANGLKFTSFYVAASTCSPSRAALLTGRYPIRHVPDNFGPESEDGLPLAETTLANLLSNRGYKTMAIGKWHLGHQPDYLPTARGFDAFYGLPYSNDMILPWCPWLNESHKLMLYENDQTIKEVGFDQDDLTKNYTEKAIEFIESAGDEPFFLYLAHSMPHLPVSTSKEFQGKSKAGLYGDVIETIDWSTEQIVKTLREKGIEQQTMLVFTSDNGPWNLAPQRMFQRGVKPWHTGSTGLLRGSKGLTYEGGVRVPGIVYWPGMIEEPRVTDHYASTMDLFMTVVDAAGAELPQDRTYDGHSFLPILLGESELEQHPILFSQQKNIQAIREGDWKLRVTAADSIQLFNLAIDPSEAHNRASEFPDKVTKLFTELEQLAAETQGEVAFSD